MKNITAFHNGEVIREGDEWHDIAPRNCLNHMPDDTFIFFSLTRSWGRPEYDLPNKSYAVGVKEDEVPKELRLMVLLLT